MPRASCVRCGGACSRKARKIGGGPAAEARRSRRRRGGGQAAAPPAGVCLSVHKGKRRCLPLLRNFFVVAPATRAQQPPKMRRWRRGPMPSDWQTAANNEQRRRQAKRGARMRHAWKHPPQHCRPALHTQAAPVVILLMLERNENPPTDSSARRRRGACCAGAVEKMPGAPTRRISPPRRAPSPSSACPASTWPGCRNRPS